MTESEANARGTEPLWGASETNDRFYPETVNQLGLTSTSLGDRPCSFHLVIQCTNATLPAQSELNHIQINATSAKVHFTLGLFSPSSVTQYLFFEIDENVTGFSFTILPDTGTRGCSFVSGQPFISYVWNGTENCFVPYQSGRWIA